MNELNNDLGNGLRGISQLPKREFLDNDIRRFQPNLTNKTFIDLDEANRSLSEIADSESVFITSDNDRYIKIDGALVKENPTKETVASSTTEVVSPVSQSGGTVPLDTTNFNKNLSSADDTIQKAMDTIDDLSLGGSGALQTFATYVLMIANTPTAQPTVAYVTETGKYYIYLAEWLEINHIEPAPPTSDLSYWLDFADRKLFSVNAGNLYKTIQDKSDAGNTLSIASSEEPTRLVGYGGLPYDCCSIQNKKISGLATLNNNDFSMVMLFRTNTNASTYGSIMGNRDTTTPYKKFLIMHTTESGTITVYKGNGTSYAGSSSVAVTRDTWHILTLTSDTSNDIKVRIDGVLVLTYSGNTYNTTFIPSFSNLGYRQPAYILAEVRLFNKVLDSTEIGVEEAYLDRKWKTALL